MKKLVMILLVFCAACQQQTAVEFDPPAAAAVMEPAPGLPAEYAAFLGTWYGNWQGYVESYLVVENVTPDGHAEVTYKWANAPKIGVKAGQSEEQATIQNGTLNWGDKIRFSFRPRPDGKLDALRVAGTIRTTGVFEKR